MFTRNNSVLVTLRCLHFRFLSRIIFLVTCGMSHAPYIGAAVYQLVNHWSPTSQACHQHKLTKIFTNRNKIQIFVIFSVNNLILDAPWPNWSPMKRFPFFRKFLFSSSMQVLPEAIEHSYSKQKKILENNKVRNCLSDAFWKRC